MWLLNRKKLTRNTLFQYLNSKKVTINGQADKYAVAERIVKLWNESTKSHEAQISSIGECVTMECSEPVGPSSQPEKMGITFAQWFYGILLSISNRTSGLSLADQFWKDSKLAVSLNHSGTTDRREAFGSEEVQSTY